MNASPGVKPFPVARLERIDRAQLDLLAQSGLRGWLVPVAEVASDMARRFGLGGAELCVAGQRAIRTEELRVVFPGRWRFAAFADPLTERVAFLAIDPLVAGRLISRLSPGFPVGRGQSTSACRGDGAIGWIFASCLEELSSRRDGVDGWRYLGLVESVGEVGRACRREDVLVGTWLRIEFGWERGFGAWLEPASSVGRRAKTIDRGEPWPGWLLEGLLLPIAVVVGESELDRRDLQGLEVGDVVLLAGSREQAGPRLRLGPLVIDGTVAGQKMRIRSIALESGGVTMEGTEMGLAPPEIGCLPVPLVAEAGRIELTVGELSALKAGDVLTLPDAVLGPVEIRSSGRLLARGELVEVEGRRGVRLLELSWNRGENAKVG